MSTMISEVYTALVEAGASEEKARKAAETLAGYDNRFAGVEKSLAVLQWMVGTALLGILGLLAKQFGVLS